MEPSLPDIYTSQMTSMTYNMLMFGPFGDHSAKNSGDYGGLGFAYHFTINGGGRPIVRSGHWGLSDVRGIFGIALVMGAGTPHLATGFRCVTR